MITDDEVALLRRVGAVCLRGVIHGLALRGTRLTDDREFLLAWPRTGTEN